MKKIDFDKEIEYLKREYPEYKDCHFYDFDETSCLGRQEDGRIEHFDFRTNTIRTVKHGTKGGDKS